MLLKIIFGLLFLAISGTDSAIAQSSREKTDSTKVYRSIQTFSKKGKVTRFLYKLIFKRVPDGIPTDIEENNTSAIPVQTEYAAFEGKIIRQIKIMTLDPFGYSISDTCASPQNILSKSGNWLHLKSQKITIRNLLLIRQNQAFDSLLVKESERLVRSQSYVREVSFFLKVVSANSDSVDILIREIDKWTINLKLEISPTQVIINVNDKNILGFGHEYQNNFTWYQTTGKDALNATYFIPNIGNTYISSTAQYSVDENKNYTKNFAFDRPFFSPLAKWAGRIFLGQHSQTDSIFLNNSFYATRHYKFKSQDFWAGKSLNIFKGNSVDERTTNLIIGARLLRTHYMEKSQEMFDPYHLLSNEVFYLAGIGISKRKYIKDKFIFKFGQTEDVPVGTVYGITYGYQLRDNSSRTYSGFRVSYGNYDKWGYLSCNFEYGTFFRSLHTEQGVFIAGVNYLTGLFEIGKWKFRQFIKPQLTLGIHRFYYENLTMNNENGILGFNDFTTIGTKKAVLTLQTQSYAPWNLLGFRFGPYFIFSTGMIGNDLKNFRNSNVYSQVSLGVLIKNENLIISTFQFSISFYPVMPGAGNNILKSNSFKTTDFGFRDFEIGKPSISIFQ